MVRVGCDIGGTFTDFVLLDESTGEIFVEKGLTTPADPSIEMMAGLAALDRIAPGYAAEARFVAHATTLIANAVIERKGARTALLTTRGFRDVLELRRHVGVESLAIAFLHAYANATNELEAARLLAEFVPEIAVTMSSSVLPQIKEFERTSAAVVNAYVKPLARHYLRRLDGGIRALGFSAPLRI